MNFFDAAVTGRRYIEIGEWLTGEKQTAQSQGISWSKYFAEGIEPKLKLGKKTEELCRQIFADYTFCKENGAPKAADTFVEDIDNIQDLRKQLRNLRNTIRTVETICSELDFIPKTFEERKQHGYRSLTPVASIVEIGAEEAKYILEKHNECNRIITPGQLAKIKDSLQKFGWIFDGNSYAFYTDGNVHDCQHRLVHASKLKEGATIQVVMAWGVDPEAGQLCAKSKPKSQKEEIERHDKTVTQDEVTTVGDIAKRRKDRWELDTCFAYWEQWKGHARRGIQLTEEVDALETFSSQRKAMRAFAALASFSGYEEEAINLFGQLHSEIIGERSTRLSSSWFETWERLGKDAATEKKLTLLFKMLCAALHQIRRSKAGELALNYSITGVNPLETKLTGVADDTRSLGRISTPPLRQLRSVRQGCAHCSHRENSSQVCIGFI